MHIRLSQPRGIQEIQREYLYFQLSLWWKYQGPRTHWFFLQITKDSVVKNCTLLEHFNEAVKHLSQAESDTTQVHTMHAYQKYTMQEAMNFYKV